MLNGLAGKLFGVVSTSSAPAKQQHEEENSAAVENDADEVVSMASSLSQNNTNNNSNIDPLSECEGDNDEWVLLDNDEAVSDTGSNFGDLELVAEKKSLDINRAHIFDFPSSGNPCSERFSPRKMEKIMLGPLMSSFFSSSSSSSSSSLNFEEENDDDEIIAGGGGNGSGDDWRLTPPPCFAAAPPLTSSSLTSASAKFSSLRGKNKYKHTTKHRNPNLNKSIQQRFSSTNNNNNSNLGGKKEKTPTPPIRRQKMQQQKKFLSDMDASSVVLENNMLIENPNVSVFVGHFYQNQITNMFRCLLDDYVDMEKERAACVKSSSSEQQQPKSCSSDHQQTGKTKPPKLTKSAQGGDKVVEKIDSAAAAAGPKTMVTNSAMPLQKLPLPLATNSNKTVNNNTITTPKQHHQGKPLNNSNKNINRRARNCSFNSTLTSDSGKVDQSGIIGDKKENIDPIGGGATTTPPSKHVTSKSSNNLAYVNVITGLAATVCGTVAQAQVGTGGGGRVALGPRSGLEVIQPLPASCDRYSGKSSSLGLASNGAGPVLMGNNRRRMKRQNCTVYDASLFGKGRQRKDRVAKNFSGRSNDRRRQ